MQVSKNIFRIIGASILLLVFFVKLNSSITKLLKIQKTIVTLVSSSEENQEDAEKKDNVNSSTNFNSEFDGPSSIFPDTFAYFVISNPDPDYFPNFIANHYPPVLTPPPNC